MGVAAGKRAATQTYQGIANLSVPRRIDRNEKQKGKNKRAAGFSAAL
jgi:hypothetical protein